MGSKLREGIWAVGGTGSQGTLEFSFLGVGWGSELLPEGWDSLGRQWPVHPGESLLTFLPEISGGLLTLRWSSHHKMGGCSGSLSRSYSLASVSSAVPGACELTSKE